MYQGMGAGGQTRCDLALLELQRAVALPRLPPQHPRFAPHSVIAGARSQTPVSGESVGTPWEGYREIWNKDSKVWNKNNSRVDFIFFPFLTQPKA